MIYYKIGCNFDYALLDGVIELNKVRENAKINEFYGSVQTHALLTARPTFRLPDISMKYVEAFVKRCTESGIEFNYTLNSVYIGSKRNVAKKKDELIDLVAFLEEIGVTTITVSNPMLAGIVREISDSIGLEISTIAHIDTITQIRIWSDTFSINKICGSLIKNRSIKFLKRDSTFCSKHDIVLNLMVNEFCNTGGGEGEHSYATNCIYRDSCYLCHAENQTEEDAELLNSYPMSYCISYRKNPSSWLKALFIRPEDIELYHNIGINHFKITGRTGNTAYLLKIAEAYLKNSWEGNLLSLWKPLETIITKEDELSYRYPFFIKNKHLSKFINHWFDNEDHDCANEVCGETCTYCNEFYKQISSRV